MMRLFYAPGSAALAPHIALEETGVPYEAIKVDLNAGEQKKPEFLAINPKGRVPALITDRGILTEAPAILGYIAQTFPDANLIASDPFEIAQMQSFNAYICATVHVAHAHGRRGYRWVDQQSSLEDMKRKLPETVGEAFDLIENDFLKGPWVMGEQYTICDPYLFMASLWRKGDGVPAERHPRVADHMTRMKERPAVQAVMVHHRR
ncbi:MAG: glutathione S-transferase family protein [Hyphomicrobiaceae bacterium]